MSVGNMSPEEARYLQRQMQPRATPKIYGKADFPATDPPKPVITPSPTIGYSFDGLEDRALPPSSASLEADLYDMLTNSANASHGLSTDYAQGTLDSTNTYLDGLNSSMSGNIDEMNALQLQGVADLLAAQQAGARGVHGAQVSGATGRRDLIGSQQDARMGRVGGQINNYESMMLGGLADEERAALEYLTGAEDFRRGMSQDSQRETMAGYDRGIAANNQRQVQLANHPDPMVSAAGAETMALLGQSKMMTTTFMNTMSNIDEQIAIDRQLGVRSEFSKNRLQLKHDVWNARTRLENDVAETKDEAALDAFDTIAAADASLAASLGAAGIRNAETLNGIAQATMQQKHELDLLMQGQKFEAGQSFTADKYAADQLLAQQIDTIKTSEAQGKVSRAQAREQMLAAKAKEQSDLNLKLRRGEDTAKYLGFPPSVQGAWGSMTESQQNKYIDTKLSGDIVVPVVIDGETIDVTMSPEAYFTMEDRNTGRALEMAQMEQDKYEFEQSSIDDMDLLEQLMAAGVPINSDTLATIIDSPLAQEYFAQGKVPPTDLLLAMLEGDASLTAEARNAELAAQEDAQRQALIDSIIKGPEDFPGSAGGTGVTQPSGDAPPDLQAIIADPDIPDWVKSEYFLWDDYTGGGLGGAPPAEKESGGGFLSDLVQLLARG
jgi:hypothetical protein